jgi:hypothetical protein
VINGLKMVNEAFRFTLELAALAAVSYWGFFVGGSLALRWLLSIAMPLIFATIWGIFLSPRASIPVKGFGRLVMEFGFFGLAAVALASTGRPGLAWLLAGLYSANWIMLVWLGLWKFDQGVGHGQ